MRMRDFLRRYGSVGAALVLSLLTLGVFALARDKGPESTVRRFHVAVAEGDSSAVMRLMTDGERVSGRELRAIVSSLVSQGARVQLGRVQIDGRLAYVDVAYLNARNQVVWALRYVVKKDDLRWQIDAGETNALRRQMFEFS